MKKSLIILIILSLSLNVFAYDNINVHQKINENAAIQSSNFINTLKALGFIGDLPTNIIELNSLNGKNIRDWVREGGKLEDETDCRSKFHFHDPTKSWDTAGLSNVAIDTYCLEYTHRSSLVWAQDSGNLWTWQKARQYYFDALTNPGKIIREQKLAYTFRSLGQVMHLTADSSIPAHTRNDIHVFPYTLPVVGISVGDPTFESWAKDNYKSLTYTGIIIDQSIFNNATLYQSAPVAISALWDIDKYNGFNPAITIESLTGLAEYTNANFFSEDTIFNNYDYPAWSSIEEYEEVIDTATGKTKTYLRKIGDGERIEHLAAGKRFYKYLPSALKSSGLILDQECYKDYAQKLIPRAVGYSAGLLNYFFRGQMEAMNPREIVLDGQITGITFTILNETPGEAMKPRINPDTGLSESKFIIAYEYRPVGGATMYGTSDEQILNEEIAADAESAAEFRFTFPNPIPYNAEYLKYRLVYRGTLGSEEDAVIGKILPDKTLEISPPEQYVYSIIDGSVLPQEFTHISAKVKSWITLPEMQNAHLYAVARYKKRTDYQADLSAEPPLETSREEFSTNSESLPVPLTPEDIVLLNSSSAKEYAFDFTGTPIPVGITDLYLQVFIADETGLPIAEGTKDLMEPAHHVLWNLTDMFSLDHHLYTAEQIKSTPSLAAEVDLDHDGVFNETEEPYIDPYPINLEIAYMGETEPLEPIVTSAIVENIPPGRYIRLILLVDRQYGNYFKLSWSDDIDTSLADVEVEFSSPVTQSTVQGEWISTAVDEFRRGLVEEVEQPIRQHTWQGVLRCKPFAVDPVSGAQTCCYNEEESIPADLTPYPAEIYFP